MPVYRERKRFEKVVNKHWRVSRLNYTTRAPESPVTLRAVKSIESDCLNDEWLANRTFFDALNPVFAFPPPLDRSVQLGIWFYQFRRKSPNLVIDTPPTRVWCQCQNEWLWNNLRLNWWEAAFPLHKPSMITHNDKFGGFAGHSDFPTQLVKVFKLVEVLLLKLLRVAWVGTLIWFGDRLFFLE